MAGRGVYCDAPAFRVGSGALHCPALLVSSSLLFRFVCGGMMRCEMGGWCVL